MKRTNDASPATASLAMSKKLRRRSAIGALLASVLALALILPSFASADPLGETTFFKTVLRSPASIQYTTAGPDGNVWFIDNIAAGGTPAIGKIDPNTGVITEYCEAECAETLSGLNAESSPIGITAAPGGDKHLWFTDRGVTPAIGVVDSASPGTATEYSTGLNAESGPQAIVAGPDGKLWFADNGATPAIGVIDPSTHVIEEFSTGLQAESKPRGITVGSDGALWFTDNASGASTPAIGRIDPTTHVIEEFTTGTGSVPGGVIIVLGEPGIAAGPDGNVWFTETKEGARGICKIEVSAPHTITCFSAGLLNPELPVGSKPLGLTKARGKLWFTDNSGVNEKQVIKFEGTWATGNEFELCDEGNATCSKKAYSTTTNTTRNNVKAAYEAIYGSGTVGTPSCSGVPITCTVTFTGAKAATDVGQTGCASLIEPTGTCSGTTSTQGVANAIGKITVSGGITRYPVDGLFSVNSITSVSDSDVWFPTGVSSLQRIGKFGIEVPTKELTVNKTGSGTVTSSPEGVSCGGTCSFAFDEGEVVTLTAKAAGGSEFTGWTSCESEPEGKCVVTMSSAKEVTAEFKPSGPTNRRTLTITKSPAPSAGTGAGTVSSKPKGVKCAATCSGAKASLYKDSTALLSAKASKGSTFVEWEGCDAEPEGKCEVTMSEDREVEAVFSGSSKAITNPQLLTVSKEGEGHGTVKSKPGGIACEADCSQASAQFTGEITEPKVKPPVTVLLTATEALGSEFVGWSGACSGAEATCEVTMSEAQAVTAEFAALPSNTLTVTKSPAPSAGAGYGTVSSKPKGISCSTTCESASGSFSEDTTVVLTAKPSSTSSFTGWSGSGCSGTGTCAVTMGEAHAVTATFAGTSKAIAEPQALTLTKAGNGTVKSKPGGIKCEVLCSGATALYQGEITSPKVKPAKIVVLTGTAAPGYGPVAWSGCENEFEEEGLTKCEVSMVTVQSVTATFEELE